MSRFREPEAGPGLWEQWLVVCPRCGERAVVSDAGLRCPACGATVDGTRWRSRDGRVGLRTRERGPWRRDRTPRRWWPEAQRTTYRLWLRTTCCGGNELWALNEQHLEYLRTYIAAGLREGPHTPHQKLQHKLPTWMKRAEHREEVLAALDEFRARLVD